MKKMIAFLSLLSISLPALAMHSYGEDNCIAKMLNGSTLELVITNGQPTNPHKLIDRVNDSTDFTTVEFKGAPMGGDEQGSELVLEKTSEKNINSRKVSDGCLEGYERTSTRTALVKSISKKLSEKFDLKEGNSVQFVCYTSFGAPTGEKCE
jgi:hypothetical protein